MLPLAVFGQSNSYNPFLVQGIISPAPLLPAEFNGTGEAKFDVGNTGSTTMPVTPGDLMTLVVTLSKGAPNTANPLDAISGSGAAWFSWTYDPLITTYFATQIAPIPGGSRESITINYKVTQNSFSPPTNGFNVNLQPPGYTNPQPTDDDAVSSYTYVEAVDYSDAPVSYTSVNHTLNFVKDSEGRYLQRMVLGTVVDPDSADQASAAATVDNANQSAGLNVDDEDGVIFPAMIPGTTVNIPVTLTLWDYNPDAELPAAQLRGWIDWGKNGEFAATTERFINFNFFNYLELEEEAAWSGPRTFTVFFPVEVPAEASGNYFARFRFGPSVGPTALTATHGEVEDYRFTIGSPQGAISGITQVDTDHDDVGDFTLNAVTYRLQNLTDSTPVDDPNQAGFQPYVISSVNGTYAFTNLPSGPYLVVQDQPAGFLSQRDWDSTTDDGSSPADPANASRTDNQIPVDLAINESDTGNNFVEYHCATLFTSWQLLHPSQGETPANLLDYAFCAPPRSRGSSACRIVAAAGGNHDLIFDRVAGAPQDVSYYLRYTNNLATPIGSWTEVSLTSLGAAVVITPASSGLSEQVRITNVKDLLPNGSPRGFFSIAVKRD